MEPDGFVDPNLTLPDRLVLQSLLNDIHPHRELRRTESRSLTPESSDSGYGSRDKEPCIPGNAQNGQLFSTRTEPPNTNDKYAALANSIQDNITIEKLKALNNPSTADFEPTVFVTWDLGQLKLPLLLDRFLLQPYIRLAKSIVRVETDVVMLTHLLLYFTTSIPSAIYLFYHFSWFHGIAHWIMQSYYVGTYTLMMHQHIHMHGILAKKYRWFDYLFPFITDPLFGHTWNSYYYHHVKHHHVESNGPNDLSSTIRYQRDDILHFMHYVGRFLFLIWFDLPRYFVRKGQTAAALKVGISEFANYFFIIFMAFYINFPATLFVFILPFTMLRLGLMVGNWGQHALVDEFEPDSDFRSSITLIDVASNRYCYNDGYHTSHHLNPRRHWRDHPVAFLSQKQKYAEEQALVFRNIDYIMLTVRVLRKDYKYLAKCLVPIGDQTRMTHDEIAAMLQTKTRRFTEEEIQKKFK